MIIDIHTHAWPDKVSARAREFLEGTFRIKIVDEPTVETLLRYMDKNHIDVSVICSVAMRPDQVKGINNWAATVKSERIKIFASLHPDYKLWRDELKRIRDEFDGIKLQPEFQDFYIDEERVYPIYGEIERLKIPILFHCGEELSGTMLVRSSPDRVLNVRTRFPGMRMIAAHFGGFNMCKEVERHLLGKDIYLDTSYFFGHVPDEEAVRLIKLHRPDRLLFGTDFPLIDQQKDLEYINKLNISPELRKKILSENAKYLLSMK